MQLSLSCRIAEGFLRKEDASMSLTELADLAVQAGYDAICMRASQIGIHSAPEQIREAGDILRERGLSVTMVTGDFDIVYNNDRGPACLSDIEPYLKLAEALGAPMIRVCLRKDTDIGFAQQAADQALGRGLTLVHQCHAQSLFETVDGILETLSAIDRRNFGLIYEAANLEECRQDYRLATISRLAPWIRNVYVQNQRLNSEGAVTLNTWCHGPVSFDVIPPYESGGINFPVIFQGLRAIAYDGPITVHQSAPEDKAVSAEESARQTALFLRRLDADPTE